MRLFLAFELPEEVKDELARISEELMNIIPRGIKWVEPENMHITLQFLGDVSSADVKILDEYFSSLLDTVTEFDIENPVIEAVPAKNPRVIWVHYESNNKRIFSLPGKIRSMADDLGYSLDKKPLKLHATLGRVKSPVELSQIAEMLSFKPAINEMTINRVTLYKSVLQPEGPVYTALGSYDLQRRNNG